MSEHPPLKPALKISEQISLLEQRGLIINNKDLAERVLHLNNYYRLNIYFHQMMNIDENFLPGTTFEGIVAMYSADLWLRNQLMALLEPIEIKLRSTLSYHMAVKYGSDCFYVPGAFGDVVIYGEIYRNYCRTITSRNNDPIVIHHKTKYESRFPIWAIVELISFNELSKLFTCLKPEDRKFIAREGFNTSGENLKSWLEPLSVLRNQCAHFYYLRCRQYTIRPKLTKKMKKAHASNDSLFGLLFVINEITDPQQWQNFAHAMNERLNQDPPFPLCDYGFPLKGWELLNGSNFFSTYTNNRSAIPRRGAVG